MKCVIKRLHCSLIRAKKCVFRLIFAPDSNFLKYFRVFPRDFAVGPHSFPDLPYLKTLNKIKNTF